MADDKDKPQSVQERMGDRVDVRELPTEQIQHTGLGTTGGRTLDYPGHEPSEGTQHTMPTGPAQHNPAKQTGDVPFASPDSYLDQPYQTPKPPPPAAPRAAATPERQTSRDIKGLAQLLPSRTESDTIKQMREKFGVRSIDLDDHECAGYKWTFRTVGHTDTSWALVLLSEFMESQAQATMLFYDAVASVSIAAIDDIPLYKHFGLDVEGVLIRDPMFPPRSIRHQAAGMLFSMLADDMFSEIVQDLANFYQQNVEPKVAKRLKDPLAPSEQSSGSETTTATSGSDTSSQE